MVPDRYRKIGFQILMVVACIFFFFGIIGGVVRWLLPSGQRNSPISTNLDAIMDKLKEGNIRLEGEGFRSTSGDFAPRTAHLSYLKNDVRSKRASEIIWENAALNMPLYEKDAVQTLSQSGAVITFDEKNFLDVSQNSLVIIKKIEESQIQQEKRSFLVLIEGNLKGQLERNKETDVRLIVNTPTATTVLGSNTKSKEKSLFEISVKPDQSSKIKILHGSAKVRSQGHEVEVKANQMTEVIIGQPPKEPVSLPKAVSLQKPPGGASFYYADFPPQINFSWIPESSAAKYLLEIAEDPQFRSVVFEEQISKNTLLYGNLKQGRYYWRVRAVDQRGQDGEPSEARRIEVARYTKPPMLQVLNPTAAELIVQQNQLMVSGLTEPDVKVYVNGELIATGELGRFQKMILLHPGINVILFESIDKAGNVAYQTRVVTNKL